VQQDTTDPKAKLRDINTSLPLPLHRLVISQKSSRKFNTTHSQKNNSEDANNNRAGS